MENFGGNEDEDVHRALCERYGENSKLLATRVTVSKSLEKG
jgi:hypothetical protein